MRQSKLKQYILNLLSKLVIFLFNRIQFLYDNGIYNCYRKKYELSPTFRFNGKDIKFYGNGMIVAGDRSYIGEYSSVQSVDGCEVIIGTDCQISHLVNIYTCNNKADEDYRFRDKMKKGNVVIGNYCWIGIKATILGPVNIGENSCVGANSVVNRDLPPHSISMGVPARVIKFKSYLKEEMKREIAMQYKDVMSKQLLLEYKIIKI